MDLTERKIDPKNLPFIIDEERWGEIRQAIIECPGVYCLATDKGEYYIALKSASKGVISREALAYGIDCNETVFFEIEKEHSGAKIIEYEVHRYLERQGTHLPYENSTFSVAAYGAEDYPGYFGPLAPPRFTPHGFTTRHIKLDEGIFLLETDYGKTVVAIAYPVWNADLSPIVQSKGQKWKYDHEYGVDQTLGYLFFQKELASTVVYDLIYGGGHQSLMRYIGSETALFADIWANCPEYALHINLMEQSGMGPGNKLYHIFREFGAEIPELEQEAPNFIPLIKNAPNKAFLSIPDSWLL